MVEYMGEVLPAEEIESRYPKGDVGVYCFGISSSIFIDSALSRGVGASANASRKGLKPNVRFVPNVVGRSARFEVIRPIPPGGEIFVSYGGEYWKDAHLTTYCTLDIPDWEWDTSDPFAPASAALAPVPSPILAPIPVSTPVSGLIPVIPSGDAPTPKAVANSEVTLLPFLQ